LRCHKKLGQHSRSLKALGFARFAGPIDVIRFVRYGAPVDSHVLFMLSYDRGLCNRCGASPQTLWLSISFTQAMLHHLEALMAHLVQNYSEFTLIVFFTW
jgi:hypothetical protein